MNRLYFAENGLILQPRNSESTFQTSLRGAGGKTKRNLTILLGICLLLGCGFTAKAQSNQKEAQSSVSTPAKEGTYQLIFNSRKEDKEVKLTQNELIVIEKLRKDNEIVYAAATYSDDIRVKILPRKVINKGDFTPLPLKYFKEEQSYNEYSQIRYIPLQ